MIREVVEAVEGENVAVTGVMRLPSEGERYEKIRQRANARLQEELLLLNVEWMNNRKGNVSFINLDGMLRPDKMGRKLRDWRNARSVQCESTREQGSENTNQST